LRVTCPAAGLSRDQVAPPSTRRRSATSRGRPSPPCPAP